MAANTVTQRGSPLVAGDAAASHYFGYGSALNAAGTVLVVGTNAGTFYTYDLVGSVWTQRGAKVSPGGSDALAVALSDDGTILAVGSKAYGGSNYGGVFIYDWSGGTWVQRGSVLVASPLASEFFGQSVALSADGTVLAVGASLAAAGGSGRGRVAIYDWSGGAWVKRGADLTPADATNSDYFGQGVALSDDGAVLAVVSKNWLAGSTYSGAVYVFDVSGSAWVQRGTPLAANTEDYTFTHSVAISADGTKLFVGVGYDDTVAGNAGAVYCYKQNGTGWTAYAVDVTASDGGANDYLGASVAVSDDGGVLVAGSERWDGTATDQGAVYTFDMVYGTVLVGTLSGSAALTGLFSNTMLNDLMDIAGAADSTNTTFLGVYRATADTAAITSAIAAAFGPQVTEAAASGDSIESATFTIYLEAIGLSDSLAAGANTTTTYADSAAMLDIIQQAINQIVADSANGADSLSLGAALTLVDIANAVDTQAASYNSVMLVAELIATLEAYNGADGYDITESGALSDAYVARVEALVALLEAAQAVDTNTALVHVMQSASDSAAGAETITSAGSLLNALLNDAVLATIRLNIGGEMFTGWVLNADTLAPSEYQFADLQFNSACKHGNTYLLAADDGIYQFTEDTGVETVMTYIKTGKTDFGSDLRKSVTNAYMVYSAAGQMVLKVTTSANGALQTNNYVMLPFAADDTPDPQRVTVGKGLKSRYWQFELVGADAGCKFDEIGMLPVVLSRRI